MNTLRNSLRLGVMLLIVLPVTLIFVAIFADPNEMGPLWIRIPSVLVIFSVYGPVVGTLVSLSHTAIERGLGLRKPGTLIIVGGLLGTLVTLPLTFGPGSAKATLYGLAGGGAYVTILLLIAKSRGDLA